MAKSASNIVLALVIVSSVSCSVNLAPPPTSQMPAESPPATEVPPNLYAGFTESQEVPFLVLHPVGETMGVTRDANSSGITGIIWMSPYGDSIVVYSDSSKRPTRAVAGEEIIEYSNYTETTVDIKILHPDGDVETFPALIDADLLDKLSATTDSSARPVAFALATPFDPQQEDLLDWTKTGLYIGSLALCSTAAKAAAAAPTVGVPLMVMACGGFILTTLHQVATASNLQIAGLKESPAVWNVSKCATLDWIACADVVVAEMERRKGLADSVKPAWPAPVPAPAMPTPTKTPAVLGPAMLYLSQSYYCRVSPCKESRDVTGFTAGTRLPILATTNAGWWQVKIDLPWSNETACWIGGGLPEGDYTSVDIVKPPKEGCGGGEGGATPEWSPTP